MSRMKKTLVLKVCFAANFSLFVLGIIRYWTLHYTETVIVEEVRTSSPLLKIQQQCNCTLTKPVAVTNHTLYKVPNIVHYIWYNTQTKAMKFHQMLGILSAYKVLQSTFITWQMLVQVLQPTKIMFHTDRPPNGTYWDQIRRLPSFQVMYRKPPLKLFGEPITKPFYYTSHSNVDRVKILQEYGGIYLDFDMLVIRPFDELRKKSCVIGLEQDTQACGSIILCEQSSFFLTLWLNAYLDDYQIKVWAYNTGMVPFKLWKRFPHLVHVEKHSLNRPNFNELEKIWGPDRFDWKRTNYALHSWYRIWKDMSPYYDGEQRKTPPVT